MKNLFNLLISFVLQSHASEQLVIKRFQQTITTKPNQESKNLKVWNIRQTDQIRINLVKMTGELALHSHPDAAHSIMVLDGSVKVQVDRDQYTLSKGDFISIPEGLAHKYWSLSENTILVSMDAPFYDPTKTIILEK